MLDRNLHHRCREPPCMTPVDEKQFIEEESSVESVEYVRTPDGKNVTIKKSREAEPKDGK